jgi:G:T-mismatch repair DNA endonuclease (very short patch repair protein)
LFWHRKLSANKSRDRLVNHALRRAGWRVLRIWEHELQRLKAEGQMLKGKSSDLVQRIRRALAKG